MRTSRGALLLAFALCAADGAAAHALSMQECFEGGDFIVNAARGRDNGIRRQAFLDRLVGDIALIQAFPPELRWFVADPADAEFLYAEATQVFDAPQAPEAHRSEFLARCFERM
jgi:hypothetical protein